MLSSKASGFVMVQTLLSFAIANVFPAEPTVPEIVKLWSDSDAASGKSKFGFWIESLTKSLWIAYGFLIFEE